MATITVVAWLTAFIVFVLNFGWPSGESNREAAATVLVLPGCLIGAGLYWDLVGIFPPSESRQIILFFLFSGVASLGVFSLAALVRVLGQTGHYSGGRGIRGFASLLGLISSALGIISFYLVHIR